MISILIGLLILGFNAFAQNENIIDLSGEWRFTIDSTDIGISQKWFTKQLNDKLHLPGSCLEQGFGEVPSMKSKWTVGDDYQGKVDALPFFKPYMVKDGEFRHPFWLTPDRLYAGAAWYQRNVTIPADWKGKNIVLELERVHWESQVWIDDQPVGMRNGIGVSQIYNLSEYLTPGKHQISICVDNRIKDINIGPDGHFLSDQTQSNWHGIIGKIALTATPAIGIEHINVDARDYENKIATVQFTVRNPTTKAVNVNISYSAATTFGKKYEAPKGSLKETVPAGETKIVETEYDLGKDAPLWNEFDPAIFTLKAKLETQNSIDEQSTTFGIRNIETNGRQMLVNGRKVFFRGTLDCAIFPQTGYPPMDKASWARIFRIVKEHGLNHVRYHSWTPPKAAFDAADEAGIYLQPELVMWIGFGEGKPVDKWIVEETNRMFEQYGNNPSFALFSIGNEDGNKGMQYMDETITGFKKADPRHLYLDNTSGYFSKQCDFNITSVGKYGWWTMGSDLDNTDYDCNNKLSHVVIPEITHEDGQWSTWPNMSEAQKYTGSLHPRYYDIYTDLIKESGMWDRYDDYYMASGKVQLAFYKATVETALKSSELSGLQLLDLRDYTGQGFAPVGVLDPFWESKGYCTADDYRSICDQTVPLARFNSYVWNSDQTFESKVVVANYGPGDLNAQKVNWKLTAHSGKIIGEGSFTENIPTGTVTQVGVIQLPLNTVAEATQATLELSLPDTRYKNQWPIWIYPSQTKPEPKDILVVNRMEDAKVALEQGNSVLLNLLPNDIKCITKGSFTPIFWTRVMFMGASIHTVGTFCQAEHPVFNEFPTENFSDWQWYDLVENSKPIIMTELPNNIQSMVEPIDDWNQPRRLSSLFEAKVGNGKLLVSSIDITNNLDKRPAARQLRQSVLSYMKSDKFNPEVPMDLDALKEAISIKFNDGIANITASASHSGNVAMYAADGDINTFWHSPWDGSSPLPQSITLDVGESKTVKGLKYTPRQSGNDNTRVKEYEIQISNDEKDWKIVGKGVAGNTAKVQSLMIDNPQRARYVRLNVISAHGENSVSVAELSLLD
ncbi:discoidin domain-containing protein [Maribellus sediminis]|uniref:discoidin domain-containing protein n=1 Tax=Maribellus sediminis TaxID=2696285 RepID=UPI00142F4B6C|nr:discoidin domain-containing protein [Maribellus sediminis]